MNLRVLIREKIAAQFTSGVCSSEILEFFVSVVSGYDSPLNSEHVTYFHRFILPLHTFVQYPQFALPVGQLVIRYVSKSGFLLESAVRHLITHRREGTARNNLCFCASLNACSATSRFILTRICRRPFSRWSEKATLNENSDVADIAISILMNSSLGFALKAHAAQCYPLIIEPTYRAARKHWDDCIRSNAFMSLQNLSELDLAAFNKAKEAVKAAKTRNAAHMCQVKANWQRFSTVLSQKWYLFWDGGSDSKCSGENLP
jgi:hypothetical protein